MPACDIIVFMLYMHVCTQFTRDDTCMAACAHECGSVHGVCMCMSVAHGCVHKYASVHVCACTCACVWVGGLEGSLSRFHNDP